jgi:phospholipase C
MASKRLVRRWQAVVPAAALAPLAALAFTAGSPARAASSPPVITAISPGYGPPSGGTAVTITGSGFIGTTSVSFRKAPAAFKVASGTRITATSPAGSGIAPVTVTTPSGTATVNFSYTPIKHIVVVDLENHSFDNVLGYWCNANPGRCPAGGMPAKVTLSDGAVVTPTVTPDTVPQEAHDVAAELLAMNGGKMNGWQNVSGCAASTGYSCISGYKPSQIPNLTKLATSFAISDRTFSMEDSPSWGGHLYVAIASLDGFSGDIPVYNSSIGAPPEGPGWGCDSNKVTTWYNAAHKAVSNVPSCIPDPALKVANGGAFAPTPVPYVPTIFDRLDAAGLSWKIYGTPKPATYTPKSEYAWSICPSLADCLYTAQDKNLVDASQFATAAAAGTLPAYSVVVPGTGDINASCHNLDSMGICDNWVGQLMNAVQDGPDWSSTAVFITFDDCGCFYDQVPPGKNPDGTQQGPRLPMIIVSPYARPKFTDDTAATFASILAYTEHNFGLAPLGVNDAKIYDYADAFNYAQAPLKPVGMVRQKLPRSAYEIRLSAAQFGDT